jgi:hypothetical protein
MGDQNLLSRAPPRFGRHVKLLVPAVFAVVSTHQPALSPCGGLWPRVARSISLKNALYGWIAFITEIQPASTPVSMGVEVRQAAGRKNNCRIFITT